MEHVETSRILKCIVIDDEQGVRKYLTGMLKKKFQVEVHEAANGIAGLETIERVVPDFIVLDINMPLLGGLDCLAAIRSDKNFANLPVVVLTAVKSKSTFKQLISLGITDYILKPIDYEFALQRFQRVLGQLKSNLESAKPGVISTSAVSSTKLLVVDHDINFSKYVSDILGRRFTVVEAASGAAGLKAFAQHRPKITLIGENMPLLNERLLAQKIRAMGSEDINIVFLTESSVSGKKAPPEFDHLLQKSFVPDAFLKSFTNIALDGKKQPTSYKEIVDEYMPSEIFNAAHQAFGIMASIELTVLAGEGTVKLREELFASSILSNDTEDMMVQVTISCAENDAQWLATTILGLASPGHSERMEVLEEIVRTISGRIRTAFEIYGILLQEKTTASNVGEDQKPDKPDLALTFQSNSGQIFRITLKLLPKK